MMIFRPAGRRVNCGRGWLSRIRGDLLKSWSKAMMPLKTLFAAAAATFWLFMLVPAHASCVAPGFNPNGQFCNGCKYEGAMSVSHDSACERPYDARGNTPIEFLGHRVVARARHGIAGLNGTTFAYAPAKGYVGPDDFAIEVSYRQAGQPGKFVVHWNVVVR
jgi:hypothetical protein